MRSTKWILCALWIALGLGADARAQTDHFSIRTGLAGGVSVFRAPFTGSAPVGETEVVNFTASPISDFGGFHYEASSGVAYFLHTNNVGGTRLKTATFDGTSLGPVQDFLAFSNAPPSDHAGLSIDFEDDKIYYFARGGPTSTELRVRYFSGFSLGTPSTIATWSSTGGPDSFGGIHYEPGDQRLYNFPARPGGGTDFVYNGFDGTNSWPGAVLGQWSGLPPSSYAGLSLVSFACSDGVDNDGDSLIDALDPGCTNPDDASELGTLECDNGIDDDGDGEVDLTDPGCSGPADASELGTIACDNGSDDDADGETDLADPGCDGPFDDSERGTDVCDNGVDDDGDGRVDFDPVTAADPSHTAGFGDPGCGNPRWLEEDPPCENDVDDFDLGSEADWDGGGVGPPDADCSVPWARSEAKTLTAPTPLTGQQFGSAVAVSGDRAMVGAPADGVVRFYRWSGSDWLQVGGDKSGPPGTSFGFGVAMDGDAAIAAGTSGFTIYRWNGADWIDETGLIATPPVQDVAISGDIAVVGTPITGALIEGSVQIYRWGGLAWAFDASIPAPASVGFGLFGSAVAAFGDFVFVAWPVQGEVRVFQADGLGWVDLESLSVPGLFPVGPVLFPALDVDGSVLLVGAPSEAAAHVFRWTGSTWQPEGPPLSPPPGAGPFGASVAVDGSTLLVGTPSGSIGSGGGLVTEFRHSGGVWTDAEVIHSAPVPAPTDGFGTAVALSGDLALLGAPSGSDGAPDAGAAHFRRLATCGDGTTDPNEECDDGNDVHSDACGIDCRFPDVTACSDSIDNDGDGLTDVADPGCWGPSDLDETTPFLICDDGVDNDLDGLTDFGGDPGCSSRYPGAGIENPKCQDGLDNDGDGGIDFDGGASVNGGVPLGPMDTQCENAPYLNKEKGGCGLGWELVGLALLRRRRRTHTRSASSEERVPEAPGQSRSPARTRS